MYMYVHIYIQQSRIRDVAEDLNLVPIVMGGSRTFCY